MRWLIRLTVLFSILWCGWWALASYGAKSLFDNVISERQEDGWQADISQEGFPFRIRSRFDNLLITNPKDQMAVKMNGAALSAPPYWPGYLMLDLPETPMTLQTPVNDILFEMRDAQTALRIRPNSDLTFQTLDGTSGPWRVGVDANDIIYADDLAFGIDQDTASPLRYAVFLNVTKLAPGDIWRTILGLPDSWATEFDSFSAQGTVTLSEPVDRNMINPVVNGIDIAFLSVIWGPIEITAEGAVEITANGLPEGTVDIQVKQWSSLLDLAERAGALPQDARMKSKVFFQALANLEGEPEDLDLTIAFKNGRMALGHIDLGPAPRLR